MKKLIRFVCEKLGFSTSYIVSATWTRSDGSFSTLTYTCTIYPWLHVDNYQQLLEHTQKESKQNKVMPNIIEVTKLGI